MASRFEQSEPWSITVPCERGKLIVVAYAQAEDPVLRNRPYAGRAYIEIPYERTLRDIDEAAMWQRARIFAAGPGAESGVRGSEWVAGYMNRVADESRARCYLSGERLGALVRVMEGWPIR
jgi:hypothetical protein